MTTPYSAMSREDLMDRRAAVRQRLRNYSKGAEYSDERFDDIVQDAHISASLLMADHLPA